MRPDLRHFARARWAISVSRTRSSRAGSQVGPAVSDRADSPGTAVDTLFFPIDTIKTRAQSQQGFFPSGGFHGVYRGLGSAVVGSAPGAATFFMSYEFLKATLPALAPALDTPHLAPLLHMLSASGGEIVSSPTSRELRLTISQAACMIRVPTEVVKQRSQTSVKGTSSLSVAKAVWHAAGIKGFYRGFGSTVAREVRSEPVSLV